MQQTEQSRVGWLNEVREHIGRGAKVAEVGVLRGNFSAHMLRRLSPRELHLIDPWEKQDRREYGDFFMWQEKRWDAVYDFCRNRFKRFSDIVTLHRAKSMDVVGEFEDESLDFVYLDGNHKYTAVLEDLEAWSRKVRRGGILAGHDFGYAEEDAAHMHPDVRRAVREFCRSMSYDFYLTSDANQSFYFEV